MQCDKPEVYTMLYINDYTKQQLDRSSRSLVESYRLRIEGLNFDISTLRNDLNDLFSQLTEVQVLLQKRKDEIQTILDEDKQLAAKAGFSAAGFDSVQKILDSVEEQLDQLIADTSALIENIDCNEVPSTCTFSDSCSETCTYAPEDADCQEAACVYTPISQPEIGCLESGITPSECEFCTYANAPSDGTSTELCSVCLYDYCTYNFTCDEEYDIRDWNGNVFDNPYYTNPLCGEDTKECINYCPYTFCDEYDLIDNPRGCQFGWDETCLEQVCTANVDFVENDQGEIICNVHSTCGNIDIPEDCNFTDLSDTPCNYDSSNCNYWNESCSETGGAVEYGCSFAEDMCTYCGQSSCAYDTDCGFDNACFEFNDGDTDCMEGSDCNEGQTDPSCGEECCIWDPGTCSQSAVCEAGDSDDDDDDDGGNVICSYVIERLFEGELREYYMQISNENLLLGFRGGFTKKLASEYVNGLGPEIIECLKNESNEYLNELFLNRIIPVWLELRRGRTGGDASGPRKGYKMYTALCKDLAEQYRIDYEKYPAISEYYSSN